MVRALIDPRAMRDLPSERVARNMVFVGLAALAAHTAFTAGPRVVEVPAVVATVLLFLSVIAHVHIMTMRASDWLTRHYSDDHR